QMFGELIGLALAQAWLGQGAPSPFLLVELGPGRGTLMADILRASRAAPGFAEAAEIWLVETSPALRAEQAKRVPGAQWADRLSDIPARPLFLIANEFFDALPISQFVMSRGQWRERVVGLDGERLAYGLRPAQQRLDPAPEGAVREVCPLLANIGVEIAARIALRGGAAIIVDYGYPKPTEMGADTFQAMKAHAFVDPLVEPGEADLTAHVDFSALERAARMGGAATAGPVDQGVLLSRLGIGARAEALAAAGDAEAVAEALHRLTDPAEMGTLFKALAMHAPDAPPPPGFET
ncbi:MAG: SAM-dependent methyltransferase, partial [Pseudomonadota bacterium]